MSESLDSMSLLNARQRLSEGFACYQLDTTNAQIRDGLIQRFEFTYEISQRMLKRYLGSVSATPGGYDAMPFADIIRSGNEQGLLRGDWSHWKACREMRSKTSHTWNEQTAIEVVTDIPQFLEDAAYLLQQLQARNSQ